MSWRALPLVLLLIPASGWSAETREEEPSEPDVVEEVPAIEDDQPPIEEEEEEIVEIPEVPPTASELYEQGRAALDGGDRDRARTILRRMRRDHLGTWYTAALARLLGHSRAAERSLLERADVRTGAPRLRYSRRTGERRSFAFWENADFVVTSLASGATIGGAYSGALVIDDAFAVPMLLGGVTYAVLSGVMTTKADRGDLPLALGIAAYVPTTTLFIGLAADADGEDIALAVGLTGTLALPAAGLAAAYTDLDPGDTQLIRDAGFWGIVLALAGTAGFSCWDSTYYCSVDETTYGLTGLLGLYGGLGIGALLAAHTEVSLERVRITTLIGYVGGLAGALVGGTTTNDEEIGIGRGVFLGSIAGLAVGALSTLGMDRMPDDASLVVVPAVGRDGEPVPTLGLRLTL